MNTNKEKKHGHNSSEKGLISALQIKLELPLKYKLNSKVNHRQLRCDTQSLSTEAPS